MNTPEERLRFVVRFAQMDLNQLRPGDWLNLRDDLLLFLLGQRGVAPLAASAFALPIQPLTPEGIVAMPLESIEEYPTEKVQALQEKTRRILNDMLGLRELLVGDLGEISSTEICANFHLISLASRNSRPSRNTLVVHGSIQDLFLLLLYLLLSREPTDRIMRCPECKTMFYRMRKQRYCTRPCVNRANMRKWRQTATGKERERTRQRARYRRRRVQGTGKSGKIGKEGTK
jgi:hypothetical protein